MYEIPEIRIVVEPSTPNWRGKPRWYWAVCEPRSGGDFFVVMISITIHLSGHESSEEKALDKARKYAAGRCEWHLKRKAESDRIEAGRKIETVTCGGM